MIIFKGTKSIRNNHFMVFTNENDSFIDIPIAEDMMLMFMRYFERLSPPEKVVEEDGTAVSK